jgi:hypothetical protein
MTKFTFYHNPTLTLVCVPDPSRVLFSLEAAASLTGVHPEMIRYYCRVGLIACVPGTSAAPCFEESALHEVRRIEHYRRHLAVGRQALPLICELRRQAESRRIEIPFLCYPGPPGAGASLGVRVERTPAVRPRAVIPKNLCSII